MCFFPEVVKANFLLLCACRHFDEMSCAEKWIDCNVYPKIMLATPYNIIYQEMVIKINTIIRIYFTAFLVGKFLIKINILLDYEGCFVYIFVSFLF